ncbi:SusC/RagA family TonB-linked outer membrane protein [Flammeovirga agarivorans]|uniref:TonB-dependent receptor n=1 Tax=Flammeovirga agarivorans TaxID=2726742 RepID=A0A7X8SPE7_9BACT|nr:TonB-dependent receptor [Flammeovirga agarivorans]NLR93956.1 TonB-dependent receptor [Flammeovirga agarivorans]
MKKILLTYLSILLCFAASVTVAQAQEQLTVRGVVKDIATGETLIGVHINVKNTTFGVSTDFNGKYKIAINKGETLVFRYLGYQDQEIKVESDEERLKVEMVSGSTELEEVVVVGYSSMARKDVVGSISTVSSEDVTGQVTDVQSMLQGMSPGVQVVNSSGAPGGGVSVKIRGTTSIGAGNDPLYIVDGVPIVNNTGIGGGAESGGSNPLSWLDPKDIESMTILKDAAETSIYGARASNGVVMITTKKGEAGKTTFNVGFQQGFKQITNNYSMLSGDQNKTKIFEAAYNRNPALDIYNSSYYAPLTNNPARNDFYAYNNNTNWQEALQQTGQFTDMNLSLNGGKNGVRYFISGGYYTEDGTIKATGFDRVSSRMTLDYDVNDKLTIGARVSFARTKMDNGGGHAVIKSMTTLPTYLYPYQRDINGNVLPSFETSAFARDLNPFIAMERNLSETTNNVVNSNVYGDWKIFKDLTFKTSLSYNYNHVEQNIFTSKESYNYLQEAQGSNATSNLSSINWDNTLSYKKSFNKKHNINVLAGFGYLHNEKPRSKINTYGSASDNFQFVNSYLRLSGSDYIWTGNKLVSTFGKVAYNFMGKYYATVNVRYDGSSRFGEDVKFGTFPSFALAWRASKEKFLKNFKPLSDLKFRASYGLTGNQNIGDFNAYGLYSPVANYILGGSVPTGMNVENLTWETTKQFNGGVDLVLFNYKLKLVADYYHKTTEDLLLAKNISQTSGFDQVLQNSGTILNEGLELGLHYTVFDKKFTWTTGGNITFAKNQVLDLPNNEPIFLEVGNNQSKLFTIIEEGQPLGNFYGWKALGVYSTPEDVMTTKANGEKVPMKNGLNGNQPFEAGDVIWEDLNGDGVINNDDRQIIGNAQPKFFGGFNNTFGYKGFSLNVLVQYSIGNQIYNYTRSQLESQAAQDAMTTATLRSWRKNGDVTDVPRAYQGDPMLNGRQSSRWVEDGSYVRLKTVTLSYNLMNESIKNAGINSIRFTITGNNLLTWTNYLGYDPEVNYSNNPGAIGIDRYVYPPNRGVTMGVNVQF